MRLFLFVLTLCMVFEYNVVYAKEDDKPEKTKEPTPPPTPEPSPSPSSRPSSSPRPTAVESDSPSAAPTVIVSMAPTTAPSIMPTTAVSMSATDDGLRKEVFGALLPILTFDVILSDEDAALPAAGRIDYFFKIFLDTVLESNSGTYSFDYSHLDSKVIVSIFNNRRRRRLTTGYSIKIDGIAYYFAEAPTRESLIQTLNVYFSFWGISDLEDHLHKFGLQSASIASISIDERPISVVANGNKPSHGGQAGASVGQNNNKADVGGDDNSSLLIAIISACIAGVVVLATAAIVCLHCHKKSVKAEQHPFSERNLETQPTKSQSKDNGDNDDDSEEEVQSLSGLLSVDLSLYSSAPDAPTTDNIEQGLDDLVDQLETKNLVSQ